jgi:D-alanine transaminase
VTDLIWLNGEIIPMGDARIGVEDRGFQFADGVYEVLRLYNGRAFAMSAHLERLANSAAGIRLSVPLASDTLAGEIRKLVARTGVGEGMVYLQLTRGVAERNHAFPRQTRPTLFFYVRPLSPVNKPGEGEGVRLLAVRDERWQRCWIKSIALLPNVLAKNEALAAGADEAVFVDNGIVTECAASNLFAVVNGKLVTHPVGPRVLPGITRAVLLQCAAELKIEVDERPLREEESQRASELFITSTTREVSWVARWNDQNVGDGRCGRITAALHEALALRIKADTQN